jgi:carbon starvation protein
MIYLKYLIKKIFPIDPQRKTPALERGDSLDYVPAKNWLILFGHHFASIAGAAPIIGPVIAFSVWGWGPAILWIVLGSILFGGVHDFAALYASMRNKGVSIAEVGQNTISKRTKYLFSGFILLTLILVIAVFLYFCAKTFVDKPQIVLPSLGLIPIAIIVGILIYRLNFNVPLATSLGLLGLASLIYLGGKFPISLGKDPLNLWILLLMVYCFFASITPVNILLQPRDYLSAFLLFAGIGLGLLGIFLKGAQIEAPFYITYSGKLGPIFPMLFVTIACGAISGFHSLIASGTTSKQIANELHAPRIGYGAMLCEGLLATIALLSVSVLSIDVFKSAFQKAGPVGAFSRGYGFILTPILGKYGEVFAVLMLNAFILTTLDTATRIGRYVANELLGIKERIFTTLILVILAGLLAISRKWMNIWAIFGASNQLIAALALLVVSAFLLKNEKMIRFTFIPAIIMLSITVSALVYKLNSFLKTGNILLSIVSSLLIILALLVLWEAKFLFKRRKVNV